MLAAAGWGRSWIKYPLRTSTGVGRCHRTREAGEQGRPAAGDVNLYRYVGNGPTNATDPTGHVALPLADLQSPLGIPRGGLTGNVLGGVSYRGIFYANVLGAGAIAPSPSSSSSAVSSWDAFVGSIASSLSSMPMAYGALLAPHFGADQAVSDELMQQAYAKGPLGQSTGWYHTATQFSLDLAAACMMSAMQLIVIEAATQAIANMFNAHACDPNFTCFVAGTSVLVPGTQNEPILVDSAAETAGDTTGTSWYLAAAGVAVALVIREDRMSGRLTKGRRRRLEDPLGDDETGFSFDLDDGDPPPDEKFSEPSGKLREEANVERRFVFEFTSRADAAVTAAPRDAKGARLLAVAAPTGAVVDHSHSPGKRNPRFATVAPEAMNSKSPIANHLVPQSADIGDGTPRFRGRWPGLRLAFGVLVAIACLARGLWVSAHHPSSPAAHGKATTATVQPAHVPIESLRVGQRVLTDGDLSAPRATDVDPETWRHLRLEAVVPWADGTEDLIEVESLQSAEWVAEHRAEIGACVPMPLDLTEMGIPQDLPTRVVGNHPCPQLQRGLGRVVTSTITHLHRNVVELSLRNHDGRLETVRPTAYHKFYSASRAGWVSAEDLRDGERLRGVTGAVTVARMTRVPGVHRVYNLSIESEHVYRVSNLGVLVHNTCPPPDFPGTDPSAAPPGTQWRGAPGSVPGGSSGNYFNPATGESFHPDLNHPPPIGPHWDWRAPDGSWWRIFRNESALPK